MVNRCILMGKQSGNPYRYYHWYIDMQNDGLSVKDFWSSSIWTTDGPPAREQWSPAFRGRWPRAPAAAPLPGSCR